MNELPSEITCTDIWLVYLVTVRPQHTSDWAWRAFLLRSSAFLRRHADLLRTILGRQATISLHSTNLNMHRSCNRLCPGWPMSCDC